MSNTADRDGYMENFGKIDLHLHLDGSLPAETILKIAGKDRIELPADTAEGLRPYLTARIDCESLNEYLKCFELPLAVLQTAENLRTAAYDLGKALDKRGLEYAEVRFAPQLHGEKGLTQTEAVQAALAGFRQAEEESRGGNGQNAFMEGELAGVGFIGAFGDIRNAGFYGFKRFGAGAEGFREIGFDFQAALTAFFHLLHPGFPDIDKYHMVFAVAFAGEGQLIAFCRVCRSRQAKCQSKHGC